MCVIIQILYNEGLDYACAEYLVPHFRFHTSVQSAQWVAHKLEWLCVLSKFRFSVHFCSV